MAPAQRGRRIAEVLRRETVGGALVLGAGVAALVLANSPWATGYTSIRDHVLGPSALHLDLSLGTWAADGLLAIFFFVVGVELAHEFVDGALRDPRRAALPIAAAVGGMAVPALVFVGFTISADGDALVGWAVPTATDIAFAVAVLAVVGTHLPAALRTFLLTLAVVDDLLAVTIIAIFYADDLSIPMLALAVIPLALFGIAARSSRSRWWILLPLAFAVWALVHASGVHATVAGVVLGAIVPAHRSEHFEQRIRPLSAAFAVPVFAFFAAGVDVEGMAGLGAALRDPVTLGVIGGLVVGKVVGIFGTTVVVTRWTSATLGADVHRLDVLGIALLGGIGFTVSLLIGDLAFGADTAHGHHVKVGVLSGSVIAALSASAVLRGRNRHYRDSPSGASA